MYLLLLLLLRVNIAVTGVGIQFVAAFPRQPQNSVRCPVKFGSVRKVPPYMFLMLHDECYLYYQIIFLRYSNDYEFVKCGNFNA